jgi:homogentisate 1,2-dioxygenase
MTTSQPSPLSGQTGFGNEYATEAVAGALPRGRNSPQRAPFDLYPELLSGTAFTAPRHENRRSWLYRRRPSAVAGRYQPYAPAHTLQWHTGADRSIAVPPEPMRWNPLPLDASAKDIDFIDGMHTLAANGDVEAQAGIGVHLWLAGRSMEKRAFVNADGEMLLVPQQGRILLTTEMGVLDVRPGEIALIPRGVVFKVALPDGLSRGYVCENYGAQFRLPELGPIGSNGLANARDFIAPAAAYEEDPAAGSGADTGYEIIKKFGGRFWQARASHSPFDVVAWHGNLAPVKYDTVNFMAIGSISFDHPDPSIFTVLTSPSDTPGTANCDFAIFPPRWMVMEDTFRPPWFHRNLMSEFMGLVYGEYDAKPGGFKPGGASLHNSMVPHGPDDEAFDKATQGSLEPRKLDNTLAFMFESRYRFIPTRFALEHPTFDANYAECWAGLKDQFQAGNR